MRRKAEKLIEYHLKILSWWLSVHKKVSGSRIKISYAFVKKPRKATVLLRFLTSA
nr:MAG TPA_asm: hypothetical protein [Caudoviricetes sp.]